ncbi:MAG: hypothetical protein D6730_14525 [Bacteroidetes bacterium]|nr:MAG: hypothetical protein D6730_14525 [Bacteroidota bacterium]
MNKFIVFFCMSLCGFWGLQAQSLPEIENELKLMAYDILNDDSLAVKVKQNRAFSKLLIQTLKRPESYDYPFDSLKTISILQPADKSFRIFTWYIVDKNPKEFYGEQYHYYFGLVQRKFTDENGNTEYVVIPLMEMPEIPSGVENMVLDNQNWLGALYYLPRHTQYLPEYYVKYFDPRKGKVRKQKFYLLFGWNGYDMRSNFKLVDAITLDPENKEKVIFGANSFYFDVIPKHRVLFFYSEYAPFSLNFSYLKWGPLNLFRKKVIVYDHLARPNNQGRELQTIYDLGPDGSYDALVYLKSKGYFKWMKNVVLDEDFNNKLTRRQQAKIRERERKKLEEAGIDLSN